MIKPTRLVVLGDPHIHIDDMDLWADAVQDINALEPDFVLVLGDLSGYSKETGSPQALALAKSVLAGLKAPWQSIIGNHDMEWAGFETDEVAVADIIKDLGRENPWFRVDFEGFSILGLSNTKYRTNPVIKHEIVLLDDQIAWWKSQLEAEPNRPMLIACHAPPIGSGVLHLGELHARVGNAFVNQNHNPGKIAQILWEHPNALAWFSGHNHLGQHYRDAMTIRQGIHFFHVGVVGRHSRDGHRHSRVIDLSPAQIKVETFDHVARKIDSQLTYIENSGLMDWLDYRKSIHRKRFVPTDPATMRQGPAGAAAPNSRRFAVVSDAHVVEPVQGVQRRVMEWASQQIANTRLDDVILNGDLTHHGCADQARLFIKHLTPRNAHLLYIPGNNEGPAQLLSDIPWVTAVQRLEGWPGFAFAVCSTSADQLKMGVADLARQLPETGNVLVISHFPPNAAAETLKLLGKPGLNIHWVCGHKHEGLTETLGNIQVHICAGLDPIKVRNHMPELLLCTWDGENLGIQRRRISPQTLYPARPVKHCLGIAYLGEPTQLLRDAIEQDISAVQFRSISKDDPQTLIDLIKQFREKFSPGVLSVHLPAPAMGEKSPDLSNMEPMINWALGLKIDDWTVHLPEVPISRLFNADRTLVNDTWAVNCIAGYIDLAQRALKAGAKLSLENVNNSEAKSAENERLSSRPWHMTVFIEMIRAGLADRQVPQDSLSRIGMIFDSGHAFSDPVISKVHGLGDWLELTAPYIQAAHIHQVVFDENQKQKRHTGILSPAGALINHMGLLPLLSEKLSTPIPLFVEVRDRDAALKSCEVLKTIQLNMHEISNS